MICCDFVDVSDTSYYCNFEIMAEIEKTNKKNICLCVDPSRSNPNNITNVANQEWNLFTREEVLEVRAMLD